MQITTITSNNNNTRLRRHYEITNIIIHSMILGELKKNTAKYLVILLAAKIAEKELLQLAVLLLVNNTKIKVTIPSPLRNTNTI